jgi:hypothetical protein
MSSRFIPMENTTTSDRHGCPSRIPQCGRIVVGVVVVVGGGCGCVGVPVGVAQTVIQAGLSPAPAQIRLNKKKRGKIV